MRSELATLSSRQRSRPVVRKGGHYLDATAPTIDGSRVRQPEYAGRWLCSALHEHPAALEAIQI